MPKLSHVKALQFLQSLGCAISRNTLANEIKRGHIAADKDGIELDELNRYFGVYGKREAPNGKAPKPINPEYKPTPIPDIVSQKVRSEESTQPLSVAERKDLAETEKAEASAGLAKLKLQTAKGSVVPRDQYISEMASRLIVLREGYRLEAESRAQEGVEVAKQGPQALARWMSALFDGLLANYSRPIHFTAIIDKDGNASFTKEEDED